MTDIITKKIFDPAGIKLNGPDPWDIKINNPQTIQRIAGSPSLGAGESYMDKWWECEQLDELFYRLLKSFNVDNLPSRAHLMWFYLKNKFLNIQSLNRATKVAKIHYNLGNELYSNMLGETMAYTCAYWRDAKTLDEAQYAKFDLICRKLELQPGERLLDLGCGWGTLAKYAAEKYNVEVVGVNISSEQVKYAHKINQDLPVTIVQSDYRDSNKFNPSGKKFDKVVSVGLCEHVGYKNYKSLITTARDNIKTDGLFLLHTIGKNNSFNYIDPWIEKYIFPNAILPSINKLSAAIENNFITEDLHNFGPDYDRTLMAWDQKFVSSWEKIKHQYDERFYRMWRYYLLSCAGAFRARDIQLWQFVLSPKGTRGTYNSIR